MRLLTRKLLQRLRRHFMIPIFTSLPPRLVRQNSSGSDLGPEYLAMCVESWRSAGFEPYTINSVNEDLGDLPEQLGVSRLTTAQDARDLVGKPLIYISDFFDVISSVGEGPVAIVNADILLEIAPSAFGAFQRLKVGEFAFFSRTDIEKVEDRHGTVHELGVDLFVFHSDDLRQLDADRFIIGVPWWDHFIPVAARLNGLRPVAPEGVGVFHLIHEEAWKFDQWLDYGEHFWRLAKERAQKTDDPDHRKYLRALKRASQFALSNPPRVGRAALRGITAAGRERNLRRGLERVVRVNLSFVRSTDG